MTIHDITILFDENQNFILGYYGFILFLTIILSFIVLQKNIHIIKFLLSALVYVVAVPGILALFLLLYNILFLGANILKISVISYFLPIIATILVLYIISRKVNMGKLPGFSKLSSLFLMISIAFGILFILQRTYFGAFIFSGMAPVLITFIIIMFVLRIAWHRFSK